MDFNFIIERAKKIIINPEQEWQVIKSEETDKNEIIKNYFLPFLIAIVVASFIGKLLFGTYGFSSGIVYSLVSAIFVLIIQFAGMYISALVINELAPSFDSKKNINAAFKLVIYSSTASYIASILSGLLSPLSVLFMLLGLYSIYLFWLGITPMMETPENKKVGYVIVSVLIMIAISFVLGLITIPILAIVGFAG
ncbi:MAG: YIP1 family protein [Bacteroidales bacterium]|nr:YIP1 family protein [Bacteroidales bacterium]